MPLLVWGEASLAVEMRWRMLARCEVHADNDSLKRRYGGHGVNILEWEIELLERGCQAEETYSTRHQ